MSYRALCLLPLVLLLASCIRLPFARPLGDLKTAPIDKGLEGEWICLAPKKGEEKPVDLRFTLKEGGRWHLQFKGKGGWDTPVPVFTTIVVCDRYLNIGEPAVGYVVWKYSLSLDGTLMLAAMRDEHVATAIEKKRLKGKVVRYPDGGLASFQVTDSVENIRAFIEKEDPEKLFGTIHSFRKAKSNK